jgi:tetratricopeptide (TPR) repeat protein
MKMIEILSGQVPGGFIALSFVLVVINYALYFLFKSSKLFSKQVYLKKVKRYNFIVLALYIGLWIALSPPVLPRKISILPFQNGENLDYVLCSQVENHLDENLSKEYMVHQWKWIYDTADLDSFPLPSYRKNLAKKLGVQVVVSGNFEFKQNNYVIDLEIDNAQKITNSKIMANSYSKAINTILEKIKEQTDVESSQIVMRDELSHRNHENLNRTWTALLNENFEKVLINVLDSTYASQLLIAKAYLIKGKQEMPEFKASTLQEEIINPSFQQIKKILVPYGRLERDTAELNLILAEVYLHEQDYYTAELCLKRALTQNRFNARVYFHLSYLHESRFAELNFKDRNSLLEYARRIDPGYVKAVYELANNYYESSSGAPTSTGTVKAIEYLQNFLKFNENQARILGLLGKIYIQTKHTLEAQKIYGRLIKLDPNSAETNYNLGICYFHLEDYNKAEKLFKQAIELDHHANSYLYMGAIHKLNGNDEQALNYFRERIRRKNGDDDHYAREAMRGVRVILNKRAETIENQNAKAD